MKRLILASHGRLAEGMADTARMIIGDQTELIPLSLVSGMQPELLKAKVEGMIKTWLAAVLERCGNRRHDYRIHPE